MEGTHFRKGSRLSSILPALATLDIGGIVLFIFGVGLIILGTSWGGSTYPWTSAQVLAPIVVGGVCFALFFVYEYFLEPGRLVSRMFPKQVAMLPYSLFSRMDTLLIAIMQFAAGAGKSPLESLLSALLTKCCFYSYVLCLLFHRNLLHGRRSLPCRQGWYAAALLHPWSRR